MLHKYGRLKEIAFNLGIEDRVFFLSNLNNQELRLILARACAFVFSPIKEPFGIVVLEAMAAGLPVIAVSEGGYTEVCNPKNSFLVKPYPSIFAEKISFLQQNPDIAKKMGKVGQRNARQFTWERTASKLETIIIDTWKESISKKVIKSSSSSLKEVLVGIQYYLWYEEGYGSSHWNDNTDSGHIIDKPFIGFYSSAKGQTIEYHLDLFEHIGLDYVILNLHIDHNGPNGFELISIQNLFDIAEKRNSSLKFSIQVAPYTDDISEIEKVLQMIKKIFSDHPNYFKLDDKPVLFWFWSSAYDYNYHFINSLASMSDHFINIAVSLRLPNDKDEDKMTFGFFEGFVPYSPLELSEEKNWNTIWKAAYQSAQNAGMRYKIIALSPGYDDTGLTASYRSGNPYRFIPRRDGATYESGISFIEGLDSRPDLVMISTFNEFHENTHIEPSRNNGMKYIELTERFLKRLKKLEKS